MSQISRKSRKSRKTKSRKTKSRKASRRIAVKSNPALWNRIKNKYIRGSIGGMPGKSSARKMQLAVIEYKRKGGKYRGNSKYSTSLANWTRQKWDYIGSKKGKKYGRYLPIKVRQHLSPSEKRIENSRKGRKYGKKIPYSRSVLKKFHKYIQ